MSGAADPLPRLLVMISGSGTNLQALLEAMAGGYLNAEPAGVISNRREAYGLVRAAQGSVPTLYFPFKPYRGRGRTAYDRDLAGHAAAFRPDLIVLAGWMHILSPAFLNAFPGQVINLHPALPGQFAGTHAIQRAFAAYQDGEIDRSGCMVHYTVPKVDAGPVVATAMVPILPEDSLADFEARMHAAEHELIVRATGIALEQLASHP